MPEPLGAQALRVDDVEVAAATAARLVTTRAPRAGRTRLLAVDGPSGAGKSTLSRRISAALDDAPVVRLDDVYPGWDGLEEGVHRVVRGVLEPLSRGTAATLRRHDWVHERDGEEYDVAAAPVVVVEGCGAGAGACRPYLSVLVWVDAPEDVRRERAFARDGDAYRPHWSRWADQERAHFAREGTLARADLVLRTAR